MNRLSKLEGIVIKRANYGEIDKIITIFTKSRGKLILLAKGIRKIHSRKAPHLELFNHCAFTSIEGKTFNYVIESQTIESYKNIRNDLEKLAYSYQIAEIINRILPENEAHPIIFSLLSQTLANISGSSNIQAGKFCQKFTLELLW